MRWEQLFADLDSQFTDLADAELLAELPGRQREAAGGISMVQRLRGSIGASLRLGIADGAVHAGLLQDVGPDWLLLRLGAVGELLVALSAVTLVDGLGAATGTPLSVVDGRFTLRLALRRIARDRAPVVLNVVGAGEATVGPTEIAGTIDRVGADFVELAQHATWEPRRAEAVRSRVLVPLGAIATVRAAPYG